MMLSRPVLLGFLWSLLIAASSGQQQISSQDTNKVYAYSYHFQHNGTTNSKDILRSVLGVDPDIGFEPPSGPSIVKTISSPSIRGFFTKGILPAGAWSHSFDDSFGAKVDTRAAIEDIKNIVDANLRPPSSVGLLPPISPDISNFAGDYNGVVNNIDLDFQKQPDFPKIPPPPHNVPFQNQGDFPTIPSPPPVPAIVENDFPKIPNPPSPAIPNNHGISRIETFSRDGPDGGKIEGRIERFSYNPPAVTNSNGNFVENAEGFRRNENFVNNNQQATGYRTQSYFRQLFRTVSPNLETNSLQQNNRVGRSHSGIGQNNNNQWWNVLNVLGNNNDKPASRNIEPGLGHNINENRNIVNRPVNPGFGARISSLVNRQDGQSNFNRQPHSNNVYHNFQNNQIPVINGFRNQNNFNPDSISFNNRADNFGNNHRQDNVIRHNGHQNNDFNNNRHTVFNNQHNANFYSNNLVAENPNRENLNKQFNNDDTTKRVMNIIKDVNAQLNNMNTNNDGPIGNVRLTWDDEIPHFNHDWSKRQPNGNTRPFSNGHFGALNNGVNTKPVDALKTTIESLVSGRDFPIPAVPDIENNNYRNVGGGGFEKFYGVDKVMEGPNSFSRNSHRGYERNFRVNSNAGYQRNNQWSTNTLRRLDAQSSRADFSEDFIDVFRDDY